MSTEKNHLIVDGGGECDYSIMSCASASPAPSDDIWCIGWNLCIRMRVERTTSYPTNIILFFCVNCQINRIPFIKWCKSPKIDDTTTSPRKENCSILSRLVLYQRAPLNSPRWWRYNIGITHPQSMYKKRSPPDILWVAYLYMDPTPQPSNLTHDSTHHR